MKPANLISNVLIILLLTSAAYYYLHSSFTTGTETAITRDGEQAIVSSCSRTTRLENAPQYDRALSLVHQRIDERNKWCDEDCKDEYERLRFQRFPANLTNCIKVTEEDLYPKAEGYFTFHSEEIRPDYYPIAVDRGYYFTDDVLIAILLAHELAHVQQYIDEVSGKDQLSCIDKEVEAFVTQLEFYTLLNTGENNSIVRRMQEDSEDLHPQLAMLKAMTTINRQSPCDILDKEYGECRDANLRRHLKEIISEDSHYRRQCAE
jgi:hypothetical protein